MSCPPNDTRPATPNDHPGDAHQAPARLLRATAALDRAGTTADVDAARDIAACVRLAGIDT